MAQVSFNGNIVNPDLKFSNSGKAYFKFSVPENHQRKNQQTGKYEDSGTTWWRCTFWGNNLFTPEALAERATQGEHVAVTGRSETRSYESNGEQKESFEVTADTVGIMPKAPREGGQRPHQQPQGGFGGQQSSGGFGGAQGGSWGGQQGSGFGQDEDSPF